MVSFSARGSANTHAGNNRDLPFIGLLKSPSGPLLGHSAFAPLELSDGCHLLFETEACLDLASSLAGSFSECSQEFAE